MDRSDCQDFRKYGALEFPSPIFVPYAYSGSAKNRSSSVKSSPAPKMKSYSLFCKRIDAPNPLLTRISLTSMTFLPSCKPRLKEEVIERSSSRNPPNLISIIYELQLR